MKRAAETGVVEEPAEPTATAKPTSFTYRAFVERVFESVYMPTYRPATARRYRELHAQRVMDLFGDMRLEDIGPNQYRMFAAALHKDGVQTKGPLTLVRTVVRAAHENGYLDKVPSTRCRLPERSRRHESQAAGCAQLGRG
jgi:hypothetical protein